MTVIPTVVVFSDVLDALMPPGIPLPPEDAESFAALEAQGVVLVRVGDAGSTIVFPRPDGDESLVRRAEAGGAEGKGYAEGVRLIQQHFARRGVPMLTAGLTDPTKHRNLLALVDRSICVGSDDARQAGLRVSDWVAAIADLAEQMRSRSVSPPGAARLES